MEKAQDIFGARATIATTSGHAALYRLDSLEPGLRVAGLFGGVLSMGMEGMQGAILRVKLRHLERWTEGRRSRAAIYDRLLAGSPVTTPPAMPYARHVYHVYAIRSDERDDVQRTLQSNGIQTGIHYPIPVHVQTGYQNLGYVAGQFPHAERAAREVLSLPLYPELSNVQVEQVAAAVHQNVHA